MRQANRPPRDVLWPPSGDAGNLGWSAQARRTVLEAISAQPPTSGPPLGSRLPDCDLEEVVHLAISQGVAGRVMERLGELLPSGPRARLVAQVREDALRHFGFLTVLDKFAVAFEAAGVDWVVLKGPVLAEIIYGSTSRGYTDLDLMVPARQLRQAIAALETAGADLPVADWAEMTRSVTGEFSMAYAGTPFVDLHWHLVNTGTARRRYALPVGEVMDRRQRVRLGPLEAWSLEPTDFAIHVALHASFSGSQRLRRLLDVERTLANRPPDWDALVERCRSWRVGLPVSVALNRARDTIGANVPDEVVAQLAGSNLHLFVVRQLSSWRPTGRLPGGGSVRNGVARSLRDNLVATTAQFAHETREIVTKLLSPRHTDGGRSDGHAGNSGDLDRYLDMASSTDRFGNLTRERLRKLASPG
jgi:hypothetical protein